MKTTADFDILEVLADRVIICDLDLGNISVTNDAENVVRMLHRIYPNKRVFYYDSNNDFDELDHDKGQFKGFKPARPPHGV